MFARVENIWLSSTWDIDKCFERSVIVSSCSQSIESISSKQLIKHKQSHSAPRLNFPWNLSNKPLCTSTLSIVLPTNGEKWQQKLVTSVGRKKKKISTKAGNVWVENRFSFLFIQNFFPFVQIFFSIVWKYAVISEQGDEFSRCLFFRWLFYQLSL